MAADISERVKNCAKTMSWQIFDQISIYIFIDLEYNIFGKNQAPESTQTTNG